MSVSLVTTLGFLLVLSGARVSNAQEEAINWDAYETMTVTDSGKAILLDATSSVTAFDASELTALGVEDVGDLAAFVPNLEIREGASSNASFFIRGVGLQDFGANATGAVTILQDGVPLSTPALQLPGLFDVTQIDVGRGPQSTGSFRNASAGAITIVPTLPNGEFGGTARYSIERFNSVDIPDAFQHEVNMGFSVPIIADVLSARVAGRFTRLDPYFENRCSAAPEGNPADRPAFETYCGETPGGTPGNFSQVPGNLDKKSGRNQTWSIRGTLRYQPSDIDMDWHLSLSGTKEDGDSRLGQAIGTGNTGDQFGNNDRNGYLDQDLRDELAAYVANGFTVAEGVAKRTSNLNDRPLDQGPYTGDFNRDGNARKETLNATLVTQNGITDNIELGTHVSYLEYERYGARDQDLTPNEVFEALVDDKAWQVFTDFELKGELSDTPLRWNFGAYNLVERLRFKQDGFNIAGAAPTRIYTQKNLSFGTWAGFDVDFLDDFTFAAGVRYQYEQKDFEIDELRDPITGPGFFIDLNVAGQETKTWDDFTWTFALTYNFSSNFSTTMKYSRGWKAGTFNANRVVPVAGASPLDGTAGNAQPEKLDAFEWSFNSNAWDNRIDLKFWAFFYDYQNYQVFLLTPNVAGITLEVLNANDAVNYGLEYEFALEPLLGFVPEEVEGLRIDIRGSWLETRFLDFTDFQFRLAGGNIPIPVEIDYSDNPLPSAPQVQISGGAQWTFDMGRYGRFTPRYDFTWTDDTPYDPAKGKGASDFRGNPLHPDYSIGQRSYALHNIRFSWAAPESASNGMEVAGWCRNLTDQRYKTFAADVSNFAQTSLHFVGEPRSCGADLSFRW